MEPKRIDLDKLEAAWAASTPGKWKIGLSRNGRWQVSANGMQVCWVWGTTARPAKELGAVICDTHNAIPALIAELRHLRAMITPEPIGEKHRDGNWWLVWSPLGNQWYKALWHNGHWEMTGRLGLFNKATHALPLPPALEETDATPR
jgi:hypothetical protein